MEHHIYLTFLSTLDTRFELDSEKLEKTVINLTDIAPLNTILQTNESALKYLLHNKRIENPTFTLDKLFFFKTPELTDTFKDSDISTLSLFEQQMRNYIEAIHIPLTWDKDTINYIDCGDIDDINNLKDSIIDMSQAIMAYDKELPAGDTVILHVDLSGGPRTAIMLMIAIIRLVAFQGIQIGSILYANMNNKKRSEILVYEGNSIYNIYDMITGFAEFNQFGSVDTLKAYVNTLENPDKQIETLLTKMSDFSEAIRLSSRGLFQLSMEDIHQTLTDIESTKQAVISTDASTHKNFEIEALKMMSPTIQSNYDIVLNHKDDDLAYIDWCLNNGYLQQALALFVEFVPRVILDSNMFVLDEQLFPVNTDSELNSYMEHFNTINTSSAKIIEMVNEKSKPIINQIKKSFHEYINGDYKRECNKIIKESTAARKSNCAFNITREDTSFPNFEQKLLDSINTTISTLAAKETDTMFKYYTYENDDKNLPTKFLRLISNLGVNSQYILDINTFPIQFRRYVVQALLEVLQKTDNGDDIITVTPEYKIQLNTTNQLFKIRKAFLSLLTSQDYEYIYRYVFAQAVTYQYPIQLFPNKLYDVDGLILNPHLHNHPHMIQKIALILNLYRILKGSRNDTAHAREEKRGQWQRSADIKEQIEFCLAEIREVRHFLCSIKEQ